MRDGAAFLDLSQHLFVRLKLHARRGGSFCVEKGIHAVPPTLEEQEESPGAKGGESRPSAVRGLR